MTLHEMDSVCNPEAVCIFASQGEGIRGEIDRMQFRRGKTGREREHDNTAAGPDIEDARILRPGEVAQIFDQLLGFGARDERAFVADKDMVGEFDRPQKMLERLALAAAPNEFAQGREFRLGERALEVEVKLDAFP